MITIPTLTELYNSNIATLESKYGESIPLVGKSFLRAWAGTNAGVSYLIYLTLGQVQKNIFADTCDFETLVRFGRVKLGRNPFPATAAIYEIDVTGTIGAVIPASTTFKSDDDSLNPGQLYILDSAFTLLTATDQIQVRALEAGNQSELEISDTLTATAPISLVNSSAVVSAFITEPIAAETESEYRTKVLNAFRLEPQGGAGADYRLWAADVSEVRESYPFATPGTTEINLYIEATIVDSTDGKGTPSAGTLTDVQASIEDPTVDRPSRKPLTHVVNYLPITPLDIDITILDFEGITADQITAIENSIIAELDEIRPFVGSIDVLADKNDTFSEYKIIANVLDLYPGSSFGTVELTVNGVITPSYTFEGGNIPFFNSITITAP